MECCSVEDKSEQIQKKALSLVPIGHEPVNIKVELIYIDKSPYYKIKFFSKADQIKFMPKWINISKGLLTPEEAESLLTCIKIEPQ